MSHLSYYAYTSHQGQDSLNPVNIMHAGCGMYAVHIWIPFGPLGGTGYVELVLCCLTV